MTEKILPCLFIWEKKSNTPPFHVGAGNLNLNCNVNVGLCLAISVCLSSTGSSLDFGFVCLGMPIWKYWDRGTLMSIRTLRQGLPTRKFEEANHQEVQGTHSPSSGDPSSCSSCPVVWPVGILVYHCGQCSTWDFQTSNWIIWIPLSSGMSFLFAFFTFKRIFMKMVLMVTQFPLQLLGDYLKV